MTCSFIKHVNDAFSGNVWHAKWLCAHSHIARHTFPENVWHANTLICSIILFVRYINLWDFVSRLLLQLKQRLLICPAGRRKQNFITDTTHVRKVLDWPAVLLLYLITFHTISQPHQNHCSCQCHISRKDQLYTHMYLCDMCSTPIIMGVSNGTMMKISKLGNEIR
eukprot:sb/3472490/